MVKGKVLIASDIHIGNSKISRVSDFVVFLKNVEYDTLILNGDIIDFVEGDDLKSHWKYIKEIYKITKNKNVYYLPGNHDKIMLLLIPFGWLLGIKFRKMINYGKYHIEHGDWVGYYLKIISMFNKNIIINKRDVHANALTLSKLINKPLIIGHNHSPKIIEGLMYDSGSWTNETDGSIHMSCLLIDNNNEPKLIYYAV